ncbi:AraC family transcriptional regulator [Mucilaginibacter hurinus]|uniref:AraC family transcriptional regulator n=1 Tax=Mucilaginibacter hurinus TaxID=2201324 RepID=A0A367GRX6_9SPHI|nr:AraC family transcriptional regulator [Mucilaginibacter hurinus]RCH55865.1 AraC family transcriptional regulator [Mucilaginibacter hurinus]
MKAILCKVDTGRDNSFSVREDILPYLYNHWHYHPELELTMIRKGRGTRLVGDSIEEFDDGDIILLGSNLPHLWRSEPAYFDKGSNLHTESIAVHFNEFFWGTAFSELPEMKNIRELLERAKLGIKIKGKTRLLIQKKLEDIMHVNGIKRIEYLLIMLELIATSTSCSTLSSSGFSKTYNMNNTDKINDIYVYTFNNFKTKITVKEVASKVNLSPHSFCRYFKTRTLKTYGQFLSEVRVGYACKLLIDNRLSISQVCYECGFYNLSNFNRCFKSITNKTPLQYFKEYADS